MEKFCKEKDLNIGTKGCDLTAIDPLAVIFTPKTLPATVQTLLQTDKHEAVRTLVYGAISPLLSSCPTVADPTMTPTDNSEGAVVGTYGAGFSQYIRGGNIIAQFDMPQKFCKSRKMMKLNNFDGGCIIVTKDYRLVFGSYLNGVYYPLSIVTNYVTPKMFDNKTDVTLTSLIINFGELDNVFPYITITEEIPELKTLDFEGIISAVMENVVWTVGDQTVTFNVVDDCTGADVTDATYANSGTKGLDILLDGQALAGGDTVTLANGVVTVTFAAAPAAGEHTLSVISGIKALADADDDITYYAASGTFTV